mgnify:CR=1 FL=1
MKKFVGFAGFALMAFSLASCSKSSWYFRTKTSIRRNRWMDRTESVCVSETDK